MKVAANGFDEAAGLRPIEAIGRREVRCVIGEQDSRRNQPQDRGVGRRQVSCALSGWRGRQPRQRLQSWCAGGALKAALAVHHRSVRRDGEAICIGFTETSGLRSVSPSSCAVSGLGFRIRERTKRSMIEGMGALLKRGVVSNNALKPTRSPQTAWGPRGLVQCSAGSCEASSKETWK